jgi:hypothetical protein
MEERSAMEDKAELQTRLLEELVDRLSGSDKRLVCGIPWKE